MTVKNHTLLAILTAVLSSSSALAASSDSNESSLWPRVKPLTDADPKLESKLDGLLAEMTLAEKIGQMIQPEIKFISPEQVTKYHIGSILNGGGTAPNNNKFASVAEWVALADRYYLASKKGNGIGMPLIWGSDAVHGHNNVVGATLFPHNIGLGASRDLALIEKIGSATAAEISVTGIDWTFAPTVAVVRDDRWGRTYESYSENPEIVKDYARAMVRGIQGVGSDRFDQRHVVATAKHFLGDGGTHLGIDRGDTQVSEVELKEIHAAGFIAALEAGVQTVMASFNSWNGEKMHGNHYLMTEVLKQQLGFDGFVVGDWNGHRQVPGCTVTSCAAAINAGLDMFMVPSDWLALYKNTLAQAESGAIPMARVNDAVRRILRVKLRSGLMEKGLVSTRGYAAKAGVLGGESHRQLAREAVRKSLVLLKNDNGLLPIKAKQKVLVAGSAANSISRQSGGWTLTWQGTGNTSSDFPGATTIYQGIHESVTAAGGEVWLSSDGKTPAKPDVAIVVIGEEPYAEWHGDISNIEYQYGSKSDLRLLRSLKDRGVPVVTVFLSGRPLWVNKEINLSDAFVAAWLPGSEGQGIADVLIAGPEGGARFDFTGRLSFSWPKYAHQTVLNWGQENYDPLFALGYGLDYCSAKTNFPRLDESKTMADNSALDDAWIFVSRPKSPWRLQLRDAQNTVTVNGNKEELLTTSKPAKTAMKILSVDKESQEDARQITWISAQSSSVLFASDAHLNLSLYAESKGYLQFDLKLNSVPAAEVKLAMECGQGCSGSLGITKNLSDMPLKKWQRILVDVSCFTDQGLDIAKVSAPFVMSSQGALSLSLADIKLRPSNLGDNNASGTISSTEEIHWSCKK